MDRWWSEERIEYYTISASRTDFHEKLAKYLSTLIGKDESVLELGAGLGYATAELEKLGYAINGLDKDERAVALCNERVGHPLLSVRDCMALRGEQADVILMLFFGRITEEDNLDYFLSLAKKKVIMVVSHHNGHSIKKRKNGRNATIALLEETGVNFTYEDMTIPFDQPLRNEEDKKRFTKAFYGDVGDIPAEETGDSEYPLVFRNNKNITVFKIEKEERL